MANAVLNIFKSEVQKGTFDLINDTIKCALLTSTHTTNVDTQQYWSDISANEVTGTGYTVGGVALTGKTVTQDNTNDRGVFDANDVTLANSTITARYAAIYKDTGVATTSPLMFIIDFGADKSSSGSDFTIQWHANGISYLA